MISYPLYISPPPFREGEGGWLRGANRVSFSQMLDELHNSPLHRHVTAGLWKRCLSIRNQFCDAVVASGMLSFNQMVDAACRYCIGETKKGGVIFWQIDTEGRVHDGKVMYYLPDCHRNKDQRYRPTWVSALLRKRHDPFPNAPHKTSHCFFGLHQLIPIFQGDREELLQKNVVIVEAEKTAFVLSELFPEHIWLAAGGLGEVQPDKFRPLRKYKVIMMPDTDTDGTAFKRWYNAAKEVMQSVFWEDSQPIHVSSFLELNATPEQKQRKIDLLDYVIENNLNKQQQTESNESNVEK